MEDYLVESWKGTKATHSKKVAWQKVLWKIAPTHTRSKSQENIYIIYVILWFKSFLANLWSILSQTLKFKKKTNLQIILIVLYLFENSSKLIKPSYVMRIAMRVLCKCTSSSQSPPVPLYLTVQSVQRLYAVGLSIGVLYFYFIFYCML